MIDTVKDAIRVVSIVKVGHRRDIYRRAGDMDRLVPISEARSTLGELVEAARTEEIFIVKHSRRVGVLLSVEKYKALLDRLEDLEDALAVATDDGQGYVPFTPGDGTRQAS